jgi:hypothetical protein
MSQAITQCQCCFCGLTIEATAPDPASLLYMTCFGDATKMRKDQEMFCHTNCLRARLHPSVKFYAAFLAEQSAETGSSD